MRQYFIRQYLFAQSKSEFPNKHQFNPAIFADQIAYLVNECGVKAAKRHLFTIQMGAGVGVSVGL